MVRKAVLGYLRRMLALDDTPERIALAFALGVFLAFSPLLGLHTLLALTLAFIFGLNRVALLVGVLINNPWTLIPIYGAAAYLGGLLVGFPSTAALPPLGWDQIWQGAFWLELLRQWRILKPLVLGSVILSVATAVISYPLALYFIRQTRSCRTAVDNS